MKFNRLFIALSGFFFTTLAFSQISHGGAPYFLQPSVLRATNQSFFIEMPSFDLDSLLREDAINEENISRNYRFAHKFYTNIGLKDAVQTVLPDGTSVKQIGIRSVGAYSINLLLRDFEIPPGGKLFIYNTDRSYVAGSFDYRNNPPDKILPIQPVAGESIIVEYSEPANVPFTGRFTIAEVNHDYRDIFRSEPSTDHATMYNCMPDVLCADVAEETIRSTVLLIINGNRLCTGSLINNTENDGSPFLLTAVHCLCNPNQFPKNMDYYETQAGSIIAFFNYARPVCDQSIKMKGAEEMSLAGAFPRVILEKRDIALLQFSDTPPDYYNAYYAGWNRNLTAEEMEHTNVHHPSGAVKKYNVTEKNIQRVSIFPQYFDSNSHWMVPEWTSGSTHEGSSGSPLFENKLIIGGLTGGYSRCTRLPDQLKDYFFILGTGWKTDDPDNQLKTYLDPLNKDVMQYQGFDPNKSNPVIRLANADYTNGDRLITSELDSPNEGFVFGNSNLNTHEFAEEFTLTDAVEIFGTYLLIPAMPFNATFGDIVSVYTGNSFPETKIYSTTFAPKFWNYTSASGFYQAGKNLSAAPTETFVVFDDPVSVSSKKFFISYKVSNTSDFHVYNTNLSGSSNPNTAWLKDETKGWVPADEYEFYGMKTSLAIQPLIRKVNNNQIETVRVPENPCFFYERSGRMLTLTEPLNNRGQIAIYSIGGQLLEKIQFQPNQTTFVLNEKPKGTIAVVKIANNSYIRTGKIMY